MLNQKPANKPTVLPGICSALVGTLVISQAVLHKAAHAADADTSALAFVPPVVKVIKYRVRSGDTLLGIASRFKITGIHSYQLAISIYLKNPGAFKDYSLHKLIANSEIVIPEPAEARKISLRQAKSLLLSTQKGKLKALLHKTEQPPKKQAGKQKFKKVTSSETTLPANNKVAYQVSPLEEELMAEVTAIKASIDSLSQQLPSSTQQKRDQARYLNTLQNLINELRRKIKQYDEEQLVFETQIKELLAEQEKLLKEQAFYQQAYNTLKPEVRHAHFIKPNHINQRQRADPESYFRHIANNNRQNKPLSPLLEKTEQLYCATDRQQARSILSDFFNASSQGKDWPDEWMGQKPKEARLYAGTMDILLSTLYRNIYRFPELTELTERVALQWDYCAVTGHGGSFYNLLQQENKALITQKAATEVPLNWSGFKQWGFMASPSPEDTRYVPELLEAREPYHAFEIFLHRIYRQHCFPHPVTGKIFTETNEERVLTRVFYPPAPTENVESYPYTWSPYCKIPEVDHQIQAAWPQHLLRRASYNVTNVKKQTEKVIQKVAVLKKEQAAKQQPFRVESKKLENKIHSVKIAELNRKAAIKSQLEKIEQLKLLTKKTKHAAYKKIELAQRKAAEERRRVEKQAIERRRLQRTEALKLAKLKIARHKKASREAEKKRQAQLAAEKKRQAQLAAEKKRQAQLAAEKKRQAQLAAEKKRQAQLAAEKKRQVQLAAIRKQQAAAERKRLNKIAAENKRNAALLAMRARLASHKTTFSEQQEGPPDDFIPISDNADGSTTVIQGKAAKDKKDPYNITTTLIYTAPLSGAKHSGKLNISWTPLPNWFARGSLKYVDNEELTYSWGVGYSDWRPGTTSFQLNNWGPIKRGEGLALDKAVFSIGHKIDSEFLREKKISTALGFSKPIQGDPGVSATFQWSPIKNWYFRTTASQKLQGGPTNWTYGFGHFDWRPETWRVEYSNYGKNRYPFDNFKEGAVTINRAWKF